MKISSFFLLFILCSISLSAQYKKEQISEKNDSSTIHSCYKKDAFYTVHDIIVSKDIIDSIATEAIKETLLIVKKRKYVK
jgi:hypothetical protein